MIAGTPLRDLGNFTNPFGMFFIENIKGLNWACGLMQPLVQNFCDSVR